MKMKATVAMASVCLCAVVHAANIVWSGAANDGNKWSTGDNWTGGEAPTAVDTAQFNNTADALTVDIDTDSCTCTNISIASGARAVTFAGNGTLTIRDGRNTKSAALNSSPIQNNNYQSYATTFDCDTVLCGGNRVILMPSIVFNGDLSIPNSTYVWLYVSKQTPVAIDGYKGIFVRGGLTCNAGATVYNNIGAGHYLVFDVAEGKTAHVPTFNCNSDCGVLFKNGRIEVGNAALTSGKVIDYRIDGAEVVQTHTGGGNNESMSTNGFVFASGRLTLAKTAHVSRPDSVLSLMGFENGVLSSAKWFCHSHSGILTLPFGSYETLTIDGTFSHTNSATGTTAIPSGLSLSGSGTFNVRHLTVPYAFRADDLRINLGDSFNFASNGGTAVFSNATLGCWADWRSGTLKVGTYNLCGNTAIDTEDVNGNGGRTIYLETVVAGEDLNLAVNGSGVAALNWKNGTTSPAGVSVGDGATLVLSNMTALAATNWSFGNGSRVVLNAGGVDFPQGSVLSLTPAARQELENGQGSLCVLSAPEIAGVKNVSSDYVVRRVAAEGGYELRISPKKGLLIIFN